MASTAISAQGTIVQIATGTGGAKTITAVTIGYPAIVTSSAHGLSNGDVVTIASVAGTMATAINVAGWVVLYKTTNTFAIGLDTTGLTYTSGGTATPVTYTAIGNIKTIGDFESGSASEIDVTNLASTAKEKRLGLVDNGGFSLGIHHSNADAGQAAMQARRLDGAAVNMKIILPSGTTPTASFSALVKKFSKNAAVDGVVEGTADVTVNGAITWS
ncbi:MAG: phage tail protein [Betaproteobacteria bacterium]|nr:phage tail protein [Betaproteobacteria bacterium]MBK9704791.1 phage tail protein [Betaproteobacteria bacterium]